MDKNLFKPTPAYKHTSLDLLAGCPSTVYANKARRRPVFLWFLNNLWFDDLRAE